MKVWKQLVQVWKYHIHVPHLYVLTNKYPLQQKADLQKMERALWPNSLFLMKRKTIEYFSVGNVLDCKAPINKQLVIILRVPTTGV